MLPRCGRANNRRGGSVNVGVDSVSVAVAANSAQSRAPRRIASPARQPGRRRQRLHHCACRTADQVRTGCLLDRRRHRGDRWPAGRLPTATYFAFRDDVLKGLIARQAEQQFAYEDRIAELRAQIDRTTSRQLLDQEQFEQKLDALVAPADDAGIARRGAEQRRRSDRDRLDQARGAGRRCGHTGKTFADERCACRSATSGPRHLARARSDADEQQAGKEAAIDTKLARASKPRSIASNDARSRRLPQMQDALRRQEPASFAAYSWCWVSSTTHRRRRPAVRSCR